MRKRTNTRLRCQRGISITEILIAALLTTIIAAAGLEFYSEMSGHTTVQVDLSYAQLICRNSLQDIKKTLRMAGYKVGAHQAYDINADTLSVYVSQSQPVDTITYYLQEFSDTEYGRTPHLPAGRRLWKLMRKQNSNVPDEISEYITGIRYHVIDSANVAVFLSAQTEHSDDRLDSGNGYRIFSMAERVQIRNMDM